jgi:hypothetical protein
MVNHGSPSSFALSIINFNNWWWIWRRTSPTRTAGGPGGSGGGGSIAKLGGSGTAGPLRSRIRWWSRSCIPIHEMAVAGAVDWKNGTGGTGGTKVWWYNGSIPKSIAAP